MTTILYTLLVLVSIALVAAVLLYVVSQKFKVFEDPRIEQVEATLPGANCGNCGHPGCHSFADAFVKATDISSFFCPVGGNDVMAKVSAIVGKATTTKAPQVAVVRCAGSPDHRAMVARYGGAASCRVAAALFEGPTGCAYGCLGMGDCTTVCEFDAIHMDPVTMLPVVDEHKCTACGACVRICPKHIIELRNQGPRGHRVFVSCINEEKGGIARKSCQVACIGCSKCQKACAFDAITIEHNLSYIDFNKCVMCRKCVDQCPTAAIWAVNFPPRRPKVEPEQAVAAQAQAAPNVQPPVPNA